MYPLPSPGSLSLMAGFFLFTGGSLANFYFLLVVPVLCHNAIMCTLHLFSRWYRMKSNRVSELRATEWFLPYTSMTKTIYLYGISFSVFPFLERASSLSNLVCPAVFPQQHRIHAPPVVPSLFVFRLSFDVNWIHVGFSGLDTGGRGIVIFFLPLLDWEWIGLRILLVVFVLSLIPLFLPCYHFACMYERSSGLDVWNLRLGVWSHHSSFLFLFLLRFPPSYTLSLTLRCVTPSSCLIVWARLLLVFVVCHVFVVMVSPFLFCDCCVSVVLWPLFI